MRIRADSFTPGILLIRRTQLPSPPQAVSENALLALLPPSDRKRILTVCEPVELCFAEILAEPGERIRQVYFPTRSFISLTTPTGVHGDLEVALIGDEGMLGASLLLGVDASPVHAQVQGAGPALRLGAQVFRGELKRSASLNRVLGRYVYITLCQLAQTAACNRFHLLEARLARRLLMTYDRAHADTFHITHDFLAHMLGVRRVGITKAASSLQRQSLIRYHRGDITILDLPRLKSAACACYAIDRHTYAQRMS
jgi:CRP-like cAMP-binding protein